ncbi:MAG: SAM-dependent methyltransferase, partial [Kiloniellales bacterium]|nr:SAM-dependent methyltransferase [Kiloniellales bacterium]
TAYQEIVGANLRGDRGQYFTPRGAIKLMVEMLDPKPNERILDPACGDLPPNKTGNSPKPENR